MFSLYLNCFKQNIHVHRYFLILLFSFKVEHILFNILYNQRYQEHALYIETSELNDVVKEGIEAMWYWNVRGKRTLLVWECTLQGISMSVK